jgi:GNAT superfamily N-acetyltransferase
LSSSGLEQRIHEIMLPFKARNLPMLWWLLPGSQPHDLERSLCEQGLRLRDDGPGMVLALKNLPLSPLTFPGFVIEEVNDEATLQAWIRTSAIAFGSDPEHIDPHYVRFEQCLGYDPALPYRRFLGRLYGLPVATAALFLDSSVAGLYSVGVLPAFRSRGYGTAISLAALHYASAQGYLLGILQSSEPGYRIYARLGFQEYCRMRSYMWLPA